MKNLDADAARLPGARVRLVHLGQGARASGAASGASFAAFGALRFIRFAGAGTAGVAAVFRDRPAAVAERVSRPLRRGSGATAGSGSGSGSGPGAFAPRDPVRAAEGGGGGGLGVGIGLLGLGLLAPAVASPRAIPLEVFGEADGDGDGDTFILAVRNGGSGDSAGGFAPRNVSAVLGDVRSVWHVLCDPPPPPFGALAVRIGARGLGGPATMHATPRDVFRGDAARLASRKRARAPLRRTRRGIRRHPGQRSLRLREAARVEREGDERVVLDVHRVAPPEPRWRRWTPRATTFPERVAKPCVSVAVASVSDTERRHVAYATSMRCASSGASGNANSKLIPFARRARRKPRASPRRRRRSRARARA